MKIIFYSLVIGVIIFTFSCSEDKLVNPPSEVKDYFPAKVGAKFIYSLTSGSNFVISGARISDITGSQNIKGTEYFVQIDSVILERELTLDTTYFRKSNSGVFYYIDTTGLGVLIPDSLRNSLRIDEESRLLFFPIQLNQTWPVFQIDITLGGIPVFTPLKTSAKVLETQQLTLAFRDTMLTMEVYKIEYKLELKLDPQGSTESFIAYGYIAENIGFVKWEGESFVLNLIRGGRLDLSLTSTYILEQLQGYLIP